MISGPRTSRATFAPAMACTVTRSPWPTSTRATCSRVTGLLSTKGLGVRPVFDRLFCEYGLPDAIRTDNGVPFATTGIHGLSQLNVWWLRLGISVSAHPTRVAAGERGARTDAQDAQSGGDSAAPATSLPQQRAFNRFRAEYNDERPHQFLKGATPASRVSAVAAALHRHPAADRVSRTFHREAHHERRDVSVQEALLFIANALKQHTIGLEEVDDGIWSIHFCRVLLGRVDERDYIIRG